MGLLDNTTEAQYYSNNDHGSYQFTSLDDVINQFMIAYVGEDKIISKIKRADVAFHAQRAMQELSFDTFKSCKSQEITVPASLQMILPHDYVNYTKISWVDSSGIKHLMYPASKTSNPQKYQIDSNDEFLFDENGNKILSGNLLQNGNFHGGADSWILNQNGTSTDNQSLASDTTTTVVNDDDPNEFEITAPAVGWHYGYNGNAIGGYNVPQFRAVRQENVPIISGEQYTVTYTISNYSTGTVNFVIVDENGDYTSTTERSANGTYTETITAGGTAASYPPQSIYFQNRVSSDSTIDGNYVIDDISIVRVGDENPNITWENYKSSTPSENNNDDYEDDTYWPIEGSRYGLDPQYAQANGSFYIDCVSGKIHFSSNVSGKTVILDYISDSLGTDGEMQVHKFAEEAMYKWIAHAVLSGKAGVPEYQVARLKRERFAETRKAKLRLSNIKLEEITQILRSKSKQIKH